MVGDYFAECSDGGGEEEHEGCLEGAAEFPVQAADAGLLSQEGGEAGEEAEKAVEGEEEIEGCDGGPEGGGLFLVIEEAEEHWSGEIGGSSASCRSSGPFPVLPQRRLEGIMLMGSGRERETGEW